MSEADEDPVSPHDEMDEATEECGQADEGWCLLAGTEHCDFGCPFRGGLSLDAGGPEA